VTPLPVLMYHAVPPSGAGDALTVPLPLVDRQWKTLRENGYRLLGLTEAVAVTAADPRAKVVAVTFDDGYADFLAVPQLLADHDAAATLYLPTSHLDTDDRLITTAGRLLTWDEVAGLPRERVEIGGHSHVHAPLDVQRPADLVRQVVTCRRLLAERAGVQAASFCYPNGYHDRRVRGAVAGVGFANACTVGRRVADVEGDRFALPRLQVTPQHDELGILALVEHGEPGWVPQVKRVAQPGWRVARRTVYRTSGRILT
jgi:peptidoglycan/xylan/chitin deacetylase (PgdA/CDA1 family)